MLHVSCFKIHDMTKGGSIILRIYFALVTFVTLMMLVFSVSDLINIALKTWVFPAADGPEWVSYCEPFMKGNSEMMETQEEADVRCARQEEQEKVAAMVRKQQSAVRDIAMLLVAAPLFFLHWRIVYRDWKDEREEKKV